MGIFVVRNGKISQWRDYGDIASTSVQFAGAKIDMENLG